MNHLSPYRPIANAAVACARANDDLVEAIRLADAGEESDANIYDATQTLLDMAQRAAKLAEELQ